MSKTFDDLLWKVNSCDKKKLAVAVAQDKAVLEAVKAAKERNIADSILVGDADKINEIGASLEMNMADYEVIDVKDITEASLTAVKLVHDGVADMYMKGLLDASYEEFENFCHSLIHYDDTLDVQLEAWLLALGKGTQLEAWRRQLAQ